MIDAITLHSEEAWLTERRKSLGASEAAAACGLSEWQSPLDVYSAKIDGESREPSEAMRWGNLLEPVICERYREMTGKDAVRPRHRVLWRNPAIPHAHATPDALVEDGLLEIKTARVAKGWGADGSGEIPLSYYVQVQHTMAVCDRAWCDVAVLIGGSDFRVYTILSDYFAITNLLDTERWFWRHVEERTPPPPANAADLARLYRGDSYSSIAADELTMNRLERIRALKEEIRAKEAHLEDEVFLVKNYMKDHSRLVDGCGDLLATWKPDNYSSRFDTQRFRDEQPDVYEKYLSLKAPVRRFLLK